LEIIIFESKQSLAKKAASKGGQLIRNAIMQKGEANIILTTGTSQFEMLKELIKESIDWSLMRAFHLDEYIGIPEAHPASFQKYLKERFSDKVSAMEFNYIIGNTDSKANYEIEGYYLLCIGFT
jgi:glucosamine-6-phosphate deaminase